MGLSSIRQVGLSKGRVEALADGIFATVMTVLVLGLRTPIAGLSQSDLQSQIVGLLPNIVAYAFSFIVLGLFWIGHHNQFHYIIQTDRPFLWINIVFLLTIGFIPFSTSLLGLYPFYPTVVRVYGANIAATGLALSAVWWYATSNHRLVDKNLDAHIISSTQKRTIVGPIVCFVGLVFSFIDTRISLALYLLLIPFFMRPSHLDLHLKGESHSPQASTGGAHPLAEE
jgi:TMEM175 potassium channel family protein